MANKSPVPKKFSVSTLIIYGVIAVILLVLCVMLGAAMDFAVKPDGKLDIALIGDGFEKVLQNPGVVMKALQTNGSYAPKMGFFGLFAIGIYALYKYSESGKRLHRKGVEHERVKELLMLDNEVKELSALVVDHNNTVYEMEDKVAEFPQAEQRLLTALEHLKTDKLHLRKLPIDPETKLPVFKITIGDTVYTDRKEAAKAFEETALKLCTKPDMLVKIGEFQGFPLSVMTNSNWQGGGMTAELRGAYPHTFKLTESFAANIRRMEGTLYKIDSRIDDVNAELARLRVDHTEAQRILSEPFPQEQELKDKQERLKVLTEELNKAALEAKRNAPQQQKTCYFELAKLKKEAMKRRKQGKEKGQEKKPKGDSIED